MKVAFLNNMSRTMNRAGLKIKKYSPEILIGVGIVGVVSSTVMACKATLKAGEIIEEVKTRVDTIHEVAENPDFDGKYTETDKKKDLTITYVQAAAKFAKLYGPAVVVGGLSIGCIVTSHSMMRKRNIALGAAYAALDRGFKDYRSRVIERFGKDLDRELKYNIKSKEIEETVVNEKGEETTVKKNVDVIAPNDYSPYSIVFDDGNTGWDKDPELTKFFLVQQQNYANDLLRSRGHLFLNEVYDMLGAKRTQAGQHVGWVYDEEHPVGDNYVDFGMFDVRREKARDFINGYEKVIVLDFNVDGVIDNLI